MALQFGLPLPPQSKSGRLIATEWEVDQRTGLRDDKYSLCYVSVQPHSFSLPPPTTPHHPNPPRQEGFWSLSLAPEHQLDKMLMMMEMEVTVFMDLTGHREHREVRQLLSSLYQQQCLSY